MSATAVQLLDVVAAEQSRYFPGVLELKIKVLTSEGLEETWPFTYSPADPAPISTAATQWLAEHPDFEIAPAVALTAIDFSLNRRNVRSVFIGLGLPADAVDTAIQNKPAGGEREELMLAWLEDDHYRFDSPVVSATFDHWAGIDPNLTLAALEARWMEIGKMLYAQAVVVTAPVSEAVN